MLPRGALQSSQFVTGQRDDSAVAYVGVSRGVLELLEMMLDGDDWRAGRMPKKERMLDWWPALLGMEAMAICCSCWEN